MHLPGPRPALFLGLLLSLAAGMAATPLPARAAASCSAFSAGVYDRVNPKSAAQLLTRNASESISSVARGFTHDRGLSFRVAARDGTSLAPVHRLRQVRNGDLFYSLNAAEIARATSRYGYLDEGVAFYATTSPSDCLIPVTDYFKSGIHRFTTSAAEAASLRANDWARARVRFYVARPISDPKFTIAVIPDTQNEVFTDADPRLRGRNEWLRAIRAQRDLRFVTHTGDVVNWDTPDHAQYRRAQAAMQVLTSSRVPFSISPGNHDTGAVCPGGSACPGVDTHTAVRNTTSFNRYLAGGVDNLGGRYQSGRVDNTYATLSAGGLQWLVLNLELWPRRAVVAWARGVVARHPRHNVIIVTHSYLTSSGGIDQTNGGYGDTSGQYLFDNLVKVYPNVRMVFSGHAGSCAYRVDTGIRGNRIHSMLLTMHSGNTNPTRVVEIDTSARTLSTSVFAPHTQTSYPAYARTWTGVSWVR